MILGLLAAALGLALLLGILAVRRFAARRVDALYPLVVAESPLTVIDRVEQAVAHLRGYAYERQDREIVIFRKHEGPFGFFEHPDAWLAELTMDLLHVTAERKDGATAVLLAGRSEPRVINRVRRALARSGQGLAGKLPR